MQKTKIALALTLITLLFACSEKTITAAPAAAPVVAKAASAPARAPSTTEKINDILMKAVFGSEYDAESGEVEAAMLDPESKGETSQYLVSPVGSTILKNGVTVFVTSGQYLNEEGEPESSFGTGGLMSVFFLRQQDGKWEILKRLENIASIGSNGNLGSVEWQMLGKDKQGMGISSSYMTQGIELEILTLFEVGDNSVRKVSDNGIRLQASNDGNCEEELAMECFETTGTWRMVPAKAAGEYNDLLLEVSGKTSTAPGERKEPATGPRVTKKISGTARYAFDGKHYKIVEGKNLVPEV